MCHRSTRSVPVRVQRRAVHAPSPKNAQHRAVRADLAIREQQHDVQPQRVARAQGPLAHVQLAHVRLAHLCRDGAEVARERRRTSRRNAPSSAAGIAGSAISHRDEVVGVEVAQEEEHAEGVRAGDGEARGRAPRAGVQAVVLILAPLALLVLVLRERDTNRRGAGHLHLARLPREDRAEHGAARAEDGAVRRDARRGAAEDVRAVRAVGGAAERSTRPAALASGKAQNPVLSGFGRTPCS
ncbi:hypothetical protein PsYK624_066600 [Phanerochaete sordida]|uniref:Uncharacterized protein n=1 Tax=Phanerochaete sordida TaxID=48140 RepID=A0A9P3LCS4_9APHY|nr:hypothetical protein PsYK624_066600 [Phanerochaete sordida]